MPPRRGYEEEVLTRIDGMLDPLSEATADMMGLPPGGKRYTQAEIDAEWNFSPIGDPQVRAETMLQLKQLGKTNEEITDQVYPNRRRLITTSRPLVSDQIAFAKGQARRLEKMRAEQAPPPPSPLDQQAPPDPPMPAAPVPEPQMAQSAPPSMLDQPAMLPGMGG